mgnify:CR=1 FL=1|jgi:hypothetical protein
MPESIYDLKKNYSWDRCGDVHVNQQEIGALETDRHQTEDISTRGDVG